MVKCTRCDVEFRDGVQCSLCQGNFDYPCAGITEAGYRKLGDRRKAWKCSACKTAGTCSPMLGPSRSAASSKSPVLDDLESITTELKRLTFQTASLPMLMESLKAIQSDIKDLKTLKDDIADLKLMKADVTDVKSSVEFIHHSVDTLANRVSVIEKEVDELRKSKDDVAVLQQQVRELKCSIREQDQRARMNNIEIKGVPMSNTENLFSVVLKIGSIIQCPITKDQINYVARVPTRGDKMIKSIVVSVHNRYLKDDFVAAAKKRIVTSADLGLQGDTRVFINDHLTADNKMLLNKAKSLAKEKNFAFTWVKSCKIFMRKNPTSPVIAIKSEVDLQRLSN